MSSEQSEGLLNRLFNDSATLSKFDCNGQLLVNFTYAPDRAKYSISLCELMANIKKVNLGDIVKGHFYHRKQSGILEFNGLKPIEYIIDEEFNRFLYKDYFHISLNGQIYQTAKYPAFIKKDSENNFGIKLVY